MNAVDLRGKSLEMGYRYKHVAISCLYKLSLSEDQRVELATS